MPKIKEEWKEELKSKLAEWKGNDVLWESTTLSGYKYFEKQLKQFISSLLAKQREEAQWELASLIEKRIEKWETIEGYAPISAADVVTMINKLNQK